MKISKQNISALSIMLTLFIFFGGTFFLFSQEKTGNLSGIVLDEESNPLPGVTVTLTGSKTATLTQVTSAEGKFRFLSLFPDIDYVLKLELGGFKTKIEDGIIIQTGKNTNLELTMEMGAIEEEVAVTAVSPIVDQQRWALWSDVQTLAANFSMNDGELERKIENLTKSIVNLRSNVNQLLKRVEDLEKKLKASEEKIK